MARPRHSKETDDMGPEDFREVLTGGKLSLPYVIKTRGGESYRITSHANAFILEAYPSTIILGVRGQGIILLGLDAIDSIDHEHERPMSVR